MAYLALNNFKYGLDTRRSELSSLPGTLLALNNGHINEGGECEKRKEFGLIESLPSGAGYTFGMLPTTASILVFGSASSGTVGGLTSPLVYQQLQHPNGLTAMTSVVSATLFSNEAFVVAGFADGNSFAYYNGVLVPDFYAGLVASWQNTDNQIASAIATLVNNTAAATNPVTGELVYTATATNNIVEVFSTPSTSSGQPFSMSATTTLEAGSTGTLTSNLVSGGVSSVAAVQAVGSFAILQGSATVGFATGTATINNLNAYNGTPNTADLVTIGSNTYYFATSAYISANPSDPFAVLVGANTTASALNLSKAINGTGTVGTTYTAAMAVNTQCSATPSTNVVTFTALASGTAGNSVPMTYQANIHATYTFSGATLAGGTNSDYISSVSVNGVNILSTQIPWDVTANQTAIDVAVNINVNSISNGGFTAIANAGVVTIMAPTVNAATFNGQAVSVVVVGQIIIQQASFTVASVVSGTNTITSITVNGTTITSGTVTQTGGTTAQLATALVTNINGFSGTSGYIALAVGSAVYVSPLTASSAASLGNLVINGTTSEAIFSGGTNITLAVILTSYSIAGSSAVSVKTNSGNNHNNNASTTKTQYLTSSIAALSSGGIPPYTYKWTYAGGLATQLVCQHPTAQTTGWYFTTSTQSNFSSNTGNTVNNAEQWVCTVSDSTSPTPQTVTSQPVTIYF